MVMTRTRTNLTQSRRKWPFAGFLATLGGCAIAPFGFGTGLWRRRDGRWRQQRVSGLLTGFIAAFVAWAIAPLGVGPGFWGRRGERWKHRRTQRLMDGYLRALVAWAIEPYRFLLFGSLGDALSARRGAELGMAEFFATFFA